MAFLGRSRGLRALVEPDDLGVEQGVEGRTQGSAGDLVYMNLDPLEEGLVPLAPEGRISLLIGRGAVAHQVQRLIQRRLDVGAGSLQLAQLVAGVDELTGQLVLLLPPDVVGYASICYLLRPHAAHVLDFRDPALDLLHHAPGLRLLVLEISQEAAPDLLNQLRCKLHMLAPVAHQGSLNILKLQVGHGAPSPAGMPAKAEEVTVGAAIALEVADRQPGVAAPTEHGALEVVLVAAVLLAGLVVGSEYPLDLVEDLGCHKWGMPAGILHAAIGDYADVVGITQHLVELGQMQPPLGPVAAGTVR